MVGREKKVLVPNESKYIQALEIKSYSREKILVGTLTIQKSILKERFIHTHTPQTHTDILFMVAVARQHMTVRGWDKKIV